MSLLSVISNVFRAVTAPLGVLEDWANEPLKRWENERDQANRDREIEREIRLQTEIARINAETEQWSKDKEFQRMKDVAEAVILYRERLTELQLNTIRAIGNMDIELREKAQNLILSKTREYKELQDQAQNDAETEFTRIIEKFSGNERIMGIMITSAEKKLASVIDGASHFLQSLNDDIQKMNHNIDMITQYGQSSIDRQIECQFNSLSLPNCDIKQIQ